MADLQGYSYNRVLGNSPDWRHTISYSQTGRTGTSATYSVTVGLQLTEGSFGFGSYVRARVTVGGVTSGWHSFTGSNSWAIGSHKTVSISITGNAGAGGGTLAASVEWNCSAYATSPNYSVSGTFSVSTWNTAPYFTSGEQWLRIRDGNNLDSVLNGYIAENVSKLWLDWGYASDNEGGDITYILQQQVNNGGWTTIDTGTDRAHAFDIGAGNEGETRIFWVTAKDNNGAQAASGVYSARITKNTLTAGWITSVSDNIYYGTNSITVNFTGGSNTSGGPVRYNLYSDTVQVYNQRDVTGTSDTITIWKGGSTPSGPYIKFDDLKKAFSGNSYKGNLHIGLATKNNNGSSKFSSRTVWVDIRATPTPPSRVWISGGTALKTCHNGQKYYVPNGSDTITFSWEGGGDPLGGGFKYTLHQIIDGHASYITEVNSSTKNYSVTLPKQNSKHTLAFGVHVVSDYGTDNFLDSGAVDIHYYNPPTLSINSMTRTSADAKIQLSVKSNTSIPGVEIQGQWNCVGEKGQEIRGELKNTQDIQTLNISLFGEYAHGFHVSFLDGLGLSGTHSYSTSIPAVNSVAFINKYGLGVGGAKAEEKYPLLVNGTARANSFSNRGYETEGTNGDKVGWWSRVASFKIHYQYDDAQAIIKVLDHGSGRTTPIKGEITARVKQQAAMGQETACSLFLSDYLTINESNFKLIEITKTNNLTDYELWVKCDQSYTFMSFSLIMSSGDVTMFSNQKLQQNPPGGRQVSCSKINNISIGDIGAMGCYYGTDEGNYYGMRGRNNSNSEWIRTTKLGLLPFAGGGSSSLGTSEWPFNSTYTKNINGNWVGASNGKNRNTIPVIGNDGVMEIGRFIDFHYNEDAGKDFHARLEVSGDTVLKTYGHFQANNNIEAWGDLIAWKYLRIHDWYGGGENGRMYYKQDGKQLILENVNTFQTGAMHATGDVKLDAKLVSWCSSQPDLYCEGRSGNYGWHFANIEGQYVDIYAKVYRQQSDERTKIELTQFSKLSDDPDERTILEKIDTIKPKIYCYAQDTSQTPIFGFFAQDLEAQFPLTVNTMKFTDKEIESGDIIFPKDKNGNDLHDLKTIDPVAVTAVLWQGLKEAHKEIIKLKDEITLLKNKAVKNSDKS